MTVKLKTRVRDSRTGLFVRKIFAKLNPFGTETEAIKPYFTKAELLELRVLVGHAPKERRAKLLAKIDGMLGS